MWIFTHFVAEKTGETKLNELSRFKHYIRFTEKKVLIETLTYSNF